MHTGTTTATMTGSHGISIAANTIEAPKRMLACAERLEALLSDLSGLIARVAACADRISGPVPQAVSNKPPQDTQSPASSMARLENGVGDLGGLLMSLDMGIKRLETL